MEWEALSAVGSLGGAVGVLVAVGALLVQLRAHRQTVEQNYALTGAQTAIAWRDQVLALHDRGLSPAQIRALFLLEDGGAGYERAHGRIEDVLRDIPRRTPDEPPSCWWCRRRGGPSRSRAARTPGGTTAS